MMDALTRRKRMQGYEVLWQPGMDHAGIATQNVVEQQLAVDGKTKEDFGRALFIDKVWDWKRESGGAIGGQMRRLGDGVDWNRERFTMDDGLSRAVRTIFKRLYDGGLIYRAERCSTGRRCWKRRYRISRCVTRTSKANWCRSATVRSTTPSRTSWWPPPGWRRCWVTLRSPCTPTTTATEGWSASNTGAPVPGPPDHHRRRRPRRP